MVNPEDPGVWRRFEIPEHRSSYSDHRGKCSPSPEAGGEIAPFRYVEITGCCGLVRLRRRAIFPEWNEEASHFECSDRRLNLLWDFCKYSIKATGCFDKYIDGERERLPYEGDACINQLGHFCCDADYQLARNTIDHFMTHPTWPTEWLLLTPILARDYLFYSGDRTSVERWLAVLPSRLLPERLDCAGLLHQNGGRDIIDWPVCERDGYELGEVNLVPNCYRYAALNAMTDLTGNAAYAEDARQLRRVIRQKFFRRGAWRDHLESDHISLHGALFAQAFGLTEPEEFPAVRAFLQQRGMRCSVYAAQFLLEALGTLHAPLPMLNHLRADHQRSWLGMLEAGSTITMEAWNNCVKPNQDWNHAWGAAPANLLPRWVAGIRPTAPGFDEFVVDPQPGDLEWLYCRQPTRHGTVELEWRTGRLHLTVPHGTVGRCGSVSYGPGCHAIIPELISVNHR
ncbi:hypothetical protein SDC9_109027 [bioreactor metagenome]|uniref:alpha-L-rhamnosidase n=1 Tax=bioreactor metagenome TaxID=1076179 RepID=A0A645BBX5_9ZZZZ